MKDTTIAMGIKFPNGRITEAKILENGGCKFTVKLEKDSSEKRNKSNKGQQHEISTIEISIEDAYASKAEVWSDGNCKLTVNSNNEYKRGIAVLINASSLSLEDEFMQHEPQDLEEEKLKEGLIKIIQNGGVKDFYRPNCAPTVNKTGVGMRIIQFMEDDCVNLNGCKVNKTNYFYYAEDGKTGYLDLGYQHTVPFSYAEWEKLAKEFCIQRKSRLGTIEEFQAFAGVLIKKISLLPGWTIDEAWYFVCQWCEKEKEECKKLKKPYEKYERASQNGICGFYDLDKHYDILQRKEDGTFWRRGYAYITKESTISRLSEEYFMNENTPMRGLGWLVFETDK